MKIVGIVFGLLLVIGLSVASMTSLPKCDLDNPQVYKKCTLSVEDAIKNALYMQYQGHIIYIGKPAYGYSLSNYIPYVLVGDTSKITQATYSQYFRMRCV